MATEKYLNIFEKYLTLWVLLCIADGILLGKIAPGIAVKLDAMSIYQVSIPIAICLFFMMYPIMVKIDFAEVVKAAKTPKPVAMTLVYLTPVSTVALLVTLILLFSFKGEIIVSNPLTIIWIAIPLFIQTVFIYSIGYFLFSRWLKLSYEDAAPASMIGASNHFEVAIATATMLFGLSSGAALATVVGVLIEVPVMLMLVSISKKYCHLFPECRLESANCKKIMK
jgi:ACR3 family arsenite efflux pump ArsB